MRDFKEQLLNVAETRVSASPVALLEMLADVAVGLEGERDLFQYTTRLAAESMRRVIPKVQDRQSLQDALNDALTNGPKAFGAAAAAYNALLGALKQRISELSPDSGPANA